MRFRLPVGRIVLLLCALSFALIALLPLRLSMQLLNFDRRGFAAREVWGSVWFGGIVRGQFGPATLGDMDVRLRKLPLLAGKAQLDFRRSGPATLSGVATASLDDFQLDDVSGSIGFGAGLATLPLTEMTFQGLSAHFSAGRCMRARGSVLARLSGTAGGLELPDRLSGVARCDGDALLLSLLSTSDMEALHIRIFGDGRYRAVMMIRPDDPAAGARLVASGFLHSNGRYMTSVNGRF